MRIALLALVAVLPSVGRGQSSDVPPTGDKPRFVPAAPLPPEEAARRDALARFGVGRLRQLADRLADAEKQFRSSAQAAPDAAAPHRELAKVSAALGRDPAAIRAARKALELDPTDGETAELLGRLLFDARLFADSAKAYREAADSPAFADRESARLRCLSRAATAAEKASDFAAAEAAIQGALDVLAKNKLAFLSNGMTATEHARLRADLYERLGQAQLRQGKAALAVAAFETARDLNADPKQANDPTGQMRLHQNLAEVFAAAKEFENAVAEHAKYLAFKPAGVAGYVRHADLLRANGQRDILIAAEMARLAELNPKNAAPKWVAAAALARTNFPAAHAQFRLLAKTGDREELFPILVAAYRPDKAQELLEIVEEAYTAARPVGGEDGTANRAAVERARHLTAAVKAVPALAGPLVRQLERDSSNRSFEVYELVGGLAARHGYADTMATVLLTAARRNPDRKTDRRVSWLLYEALSSQRRWRELARAAEELSDIGDNKIDLSAASQVALALAEVGDERGALAAIKKIEGRIYIRLQTARVWTAVGKPKQAVTECEEILAKDNPRGADLRSVRVAYATALLAVKEFDKAEAELRAVLEDDPDDVLALNNLGYNLADQGRKLPEAEALIRRAIELDEFDRRKRGAAEATSGTYLDSLAWVLFRRGKAADARKLFEKVVTTPDASHDPVVWDHYGDVCFRLGDKPAAKAAWEKAAGYYADSHQGREAGRLEEVRRKIGLAK